VIKRESELKSAFTKVLKEQQPNAIILLFASAGAPDREITEGGRTIHLEFKHATPEFDSDGLQELTCMRLAAEGYCRYVLWWEDGRDKFTLIVHPNVVHSVLKAKRRGPWPMYAESKHPGFDHHWLVNQLRDIPRVWAR